jgi:uncharacterized alpha-E superfamily protein
MSSHRAFHWAYGGEVTASKIAHFLVLNPLCPRSLITCAYALLEHLQSLDRRYGRPSTAKTQGNSLLAQLAETNIDDVFEEGLHEFLTRFIGETSRLAYTIHESYLSGDIR